MELKFALLKIDHKKAVIYKLGGLDEGKVGEEIPFDPSKKRFKLHQRGIFTWEGQRAPEDFTYFKQVIKDIKEYDGIVIASHGSGSSNEGSNFIKYLKEHHHNDIAGKILDEVKTDEHETENQLLAKVDHKLLLNHLGKKGEW